MTFQQLVKSFIAGITLPSIFLPLAYTLLYILKPQTFQQNPLQFIPMYIPILFGITNIIYHWISHRHLTQHINRKLWITGICLGLIVAVFGIFIFNVPSLVFGLSHGFQYIPLVALPIIYGAIFRFIVKWLNTMLDI